MREFTVLLVLEGTCPWYKGGVGEWVHQYLKYSSFLTFNIIQIATKEYLHTQVNEALYNVPAQVQKFERILPLKLSGRGQAYLFQYQWIESIDRKIKPCLDKSRMVHVVNTGFAGWLGKELASRFKTPLVLTEHASYWQDRSWNFSINRGMEKNDRGGMPGCPASSYLGKDLQQQSFSVSFHNKT